MELTERQVQKIEAAKYKLKGWFSFIYEPSKFRWDKNPQARSSSHVYRVFSAICVGADMRRVEDPIIVAHIISWMEDTEGDIEIWLVHSQKEHI